MDAIDIIFFIISSMCIGLMLYLLYMVLTDWKKTKEEKKWLAKKLKELEEPKSTLENNLKFDKK